MSEPTATDARHEDARRAVWQQLATVYHGLSGAHRATVVAAALAVIVGFACVSMDRGQTGYVPVLKGRTFHEDELTEARKQLAAAGLTDFQVKEDQILAPAADSARFDAALSADGTDATGWAGAWQQANASLPPFATGRQQQDAREIARARLISQLLAQLPDVAQAEIVWDEEPRVGWRQPPKVRATVYLQPRVPREITLDVVQAVKRAVAGSKAHLDPADIVVLDLQQMIAYGPATRSDETTSDQQRLAVMTAAYRQRIADALADVEGVRVAVVVEPAGAGIPSEPPTDPTRSELPSVSVTPTPDLNSHPHRPWTSGGGPNLRLEVPRFVEPLDSEIATGPSLPAMAVASNQVVHRSVSNLAAPDRVNVTISYAPGYVRRQAESSHTAAGFARMPPPRQQALLADIERAVRRNIRERVAAIIPGASPEDRLARVQVVPAMTLVDVTSDAVPDGHSLAASQAVVADAGRSAQWMIVGMIACLGVWTLYQIARALRGRRRNSLPVSRSSAERQADAVDPAKNPVRHPVDRKGDPVAADVPMTTATPTHESNPHRVAELLASIERDDVDRWGRDVTHESPGVIAALLRQLPPERVADVLTGLSAEVQTEVLSLLAGMDSSAAAPVMQPVRRQAQSPRVDRGITGAGHRPRGWFQRRRTTDSRAEADWSVMATMTAGDASDLDQITELDASVLRTRYAELPADIWSTALMGASSAFRVRLLSALPAADAAALRQVLTRQRPARLSEIESAQSQVLALLNGVGAVTAGLR